MLLGGVLSVVRTATSATRYHTAKMHIGSDDLAVYSVSRHSQPEHLRIGYFAKYTLMDP